MCDLHPLNFLGVYPDLFPQEEEDSPIPNEDSLLDTVQLEHFLKVGVQTMFYWIQIIHLGMFWKSHQFMPLLS